MTVPGWCTRPESINPHRFRQKEILGEGVEVSRQRCARNIPIQCVISPPHKEFGMPREVEPSINEKQFFSKALKEKLRIDGRSFDQFRALGLEFGDEYGVADVRLGKTR